MPCVQETITIRPTVPKSELIKRSGGNLNKWINGLIEQALGERALDWDAHFRWDGPSLVGRTPIGRATVAVLAINDADRIELRLILIDEGVFPP